MSTQNAPQSPSLPWRFTSSMIMGLTGALSRGFLYGLNKTETVGLDKFLQTLDKRKDVEGRERGLITGNCSARLGGDGELYTDARLNSVKSCQCVCSNTRYICHHGKPILTSVACRMDDPLIWGVLPTSYAFNPSNHRWSLGSYDICFQNRQASLGAIYAAQLLTIADSSAHSSTMDKSFQRIEATTQNLAVSSNLP